jgi:hypothetical protein
MRVLTFLALVILLPAPAHAQANREAQERAAKKACLVGDTVRGVEILADLFVDTNDPTYIFNQGRCFEQNQRYQEAIGRFREYLVKAKNISPEERADTNKHIATCESYLAPASPKPGEERRPDQTGAITGIATPLPPRESTGTGLRVAGAITAAAGGACLVTGLMLNLKANSMSNDLENNYDPSVDSSRKSYKTAGWIAYSAGAALVVGGAVLYYLGWQRDRRSPSITVVPAASGDMAGTFIVGAF